MKRILSFSLVFFITLGLCISPTPKATAAENEAAAAAQRLYDLGVFHGVGTNSDGTPDFDLNRAPTRAEAITMLVRLLGGEDAALLGYEWGEYFCPFSDVPEWAKPYVAYAYDRGLTVGQSETTFGSNLPTTVSEYLTFILRSMGYDSGVDFQWDQAWTLSDKLGITNGQYNSSSHFTRGDFAIISLNAFAARGNDITIRMCYTGNAPLNWVVARYENDFPFGPDVTFTPLTAVSNFCIVQFEAAETDDYESFAWRISDISLYVGELLPGQAVEALLYIGEYLPVMGYAYTDQNGVDHVFYVSEGGGDYSSIYASSDMIEQRIPLP